MALRTQQRNALLRDLLAMRASMRKAGVPKTSPPIRRRRYGERTVVQTLQEVHGKIDKAIVAVRRGKVAFPSYLLGLASAIAIVENDSEYLQNAAFRKTLKTR